MKRSDVRDAMTKAFVEVGVLTYRNILTSGLGADRPNRQKTDEAFRKALAIDIEAHAMAMKAIDENPDLENC